MLACRSIGVFVTVPLRLLVAALVALGGLLAAAPADAAVYTSSGLRCTIVGTSGKDRLVGSARRDVICGRGGADTIVAGGGDDVIDGGAGGDTITGGSGRDVARGAGGNDDLVGGSGRDSLDGGAGTNWCSMDPSDTVTHCVYDEEAPVVRAIGLSRRQVDVTDSDKTVRVRVHVTDDTGAASVQVHLAGGYGEAHLVGGTIRNGWWSVGIRLRRWAEPGDFQVQVSARDRMNRWDNGDWQLQNPRVLRVIDRKPDRSRPVVRKLTAPTENTVVNVRRAARTVHVRAHLVDTVSGIATAQFCAKNICAQGELVRGTIRNGWWEADLRIPKRAIGGDWNVSIMISDYAHSSDYEYWQGPDVYRLVASDPAGVPSNTHAIPGGAGRFRVIGTKDSNAPVLVGLSATPKIVGTLAGAATVQVSMHVTDVEGVTEVGGWLQSADSEGGPGFSLAEFARVTGTARDGVWRSTVVLPQGTPPGVYAFQAWVEDKTHWRSYMSASYPNVEMHPEMEIMPWDPKVTVRAE
jgi:Ca2+-binding RTX toxin-like protein